MRRIASGFVLAGAIALGLATTASAQTPTISPARMSVSAGMTQSRFIGKDAEKFDLDNNLNGIYVGLAADIPLLGTIVRAAPGARYISRGYVFGGDNSSYRLNYLEVVAPLVIEIPVVGSLALNLSAGPGFGLSMGCKIKTTNADGVRRSLDCQNNDLFLHGYDITAFGGGGISFALPNTTRLLVNASIDRSLTSVDADGSVDYRNRSILIGAQVTFPMGRRGR